MTLTRITQDEMPARIYDLPRNKAGYPVPWFVEWINGEPDFRVIAVSKIKEAVRSGLCWTCGQPYGAESVAFVIGPMCAVNRTSGEPPNHLACAIYAARHCPFLTIPKMHRREKGLPEGGVMHTAGLKRNPGCALVWIATPPIQAYPSEHTILFDVGEPRLVLWFAEGREATRDEVMASIDSGMPLLRKMANEDGPIALRALDEAYQRALLFVPPL